MKIPCHLLMLMLLYSIPAPSQSNDKPDDLLVFEGTILQIGGRKPPSGQFIFHRLAKYRVERVCHGKYEEKEIIVDHLSLITGEELESVKVGDRVCIAAKLIRESPHTFEKGLREQPHITNFYYEGGEMVRPQEKSCECMKEAIYYLGNRSKKANKSLQ